MTLQAREVSVGPFSTKPPWLYIYLRACQVNVVFGCFKDLYTALCSGRTKSCIYCLFNFFAERACAPCSFIIDLA